MVQHISFTDPFRCFVHLENILVCIGTVPHEKGPMIEHSAVAYVRYYTNHREVFTWQKAIYHHFVLTD